MWPSYSNVPQPGQRRNPFARGFFGMIGGGGSMRRAAELDLAMYDTKRGIDHDYHSKDVSHRTDEAIRSHREKTGINLGTLDELEKRNNSAVGQNGKPHVRRLSGFNIGSDGQMSMSYQSEFENKAPSMPPAPDDQRDGTVEEKKTTTKKTTSSRTKKATDSVAESAPAVKKATKRVSAAEKKAAAGSDKSAASKGPYSGTTKKATKKTTKGTK